MTNEQLYIAVGIPLLFNATLIGVLIAYVNAKFQGMDAKFEARFDTIDERFRGVNARFDAINDRFDDMRDLWRAELGRVEEVLDVRLRHIEERR